MSRWLYRIPFGLAILAFAVMEVWYFADNRDETEPLTHWLIQLPWWVLVPFSLGVAVWLPVHLWGAKRRQG